MEVVEVLVYKFQEGVFFAKVLVSNGESIEEIDSRVSDAVGVAVRFRSPIRCYDSVVKQAGINPEEFSESLEYDVDIHIDLGEIDDTPDLELLESELKEAIDNEDYELASELRDQIDKIKNKNKDE